MKNTLNILFAILLLTTATTFAQESKTFEVDKFNNISIGVHSIVELKQGAAQLKIDGDAKELQDIEVKVTGGELIVKRKSRWGKFNSKPLHIYVQTPDINKLSLSGSVKLKAPSDIKTNNLRVDVSGAGKCDFANIMADRINIHISGSGKINMAGDQRVKEFSISVSGSGRLEALNLPIDHFDANISGSGRATVHCTELLEANISGSGRILYKGQPRFDTSVSGSGKVKPYVD